MRAWFLTLMVMPTLVMANCHDYTVIIKNKTHNLWELTQVAQSGGSHRDLPRFIMPGAYVTYSFSDLMNTVDGDTGALKYRYDDIKGTLYFNQEGGTGQFSLVLNKTQCIDADSLLPSSGKIATSIGQGSNLIRLSRQLEPNAFSGADGLSEYEIY